VPVSCKLCVEDGDTPIVILKTRWRCPHEPARLGGTGIGLYGRTKQNRRYRMLRSGKRQAPAGGEIENFRCTGNFRDDDAEARAAQRFMGSLECIGCIGGLHQQKAHRIKSQLQSARRRKLAELECCKILTDPKQ